MKLLLFLFLSAISGSLLLQGCYADKEDLLYPASGTPCDTTLPAKYSGDVAPVMNTSCNLSGCHNSTDAASGIILDTYSGVKTQAQNGRLAGSITHSPNFSPMPKNAAKLNSCILAKIQQWINNGSPAN